MTKANKDNPFFFFTGACSSGKSVIAQKTAEYLSPHRLFIATAYRTSDHEMEKRIQRHQRQRDQTWRLYELKQYEAPNLYQILPQLNITTEAVLLDCLSLWVANYLETPHTDSSLEDQTNTLLVSLAALNTPVILVSQEIGMGLAPANKDGRLFRDCLGKVNQTAAKFAETAACIVSGLPLLLKGNLPAQLFPRT